MSVGPGGPGRVPTRLYRSFFQPPPPKVKKLLAYLWFMIIIAALGVPTFLAVAVRDFVWGQVDNGLVCLALVPFCLVSAAIPFRLVRRFTDPRRALPPAVGEKLKQDPSWGPKERTDSYDVNVVLDNGVIVGPVRVVAGRIMRVCGKAYLPFNAESVVDVTVLRSTN